jgi:6-phosphogluconolactonase
VRLTPGGKAHCVLPSSDGAFVYATSLADDRIDWYRRTASSFEEAGSVASAPGSGPRHLRFSASGDVLYAIHEMSGTVDVFGRDAQTGDLRELQVVSSIPEDLGLVPGRARGSDVPDPGPDAIWCSDVQLGAGGRFLFTTERSSSTVSAFAVDPENGTLTFLRTTETETQPRGAAVDPTGEFLLVCGQVSNHVSAYRIGNDGLLEATDRASTSPGPMWIETVAAAGGASA